MRFAGRSLKSLEFVIGKYLGMIASVSAIMLIMTGVFMLVMAVSNTPIHGTIFTSVYLSVIEVAMVTALMTFFSSFTSPMLSSFFTICIFGAGHLSKDLLEFAERFTGAAPKFFAHVAYYLLPKLGLFNVREEAVHGLTLPAGYHTTEIQ